MTGHHRSRGRWSLCFRLPFATIDHTGHNHVTPYTNESETMTNTTTPEIHGANYPVTISDAAPIEAVAAWATLVATIIGPVDDDGAAIIELDDDGARVISDEHRDTIDATTATTISEWTTIDATTRGHMVKALAMAAATNMAANMAAWGADLAYVIDATTRATTAVTIVSERAKTVKLTSDEKATLAVSLLLSAAATLATHDDDTSDEQSLTVLAAMGRDVVDAYANVDVTSDRYTKKVATLADDAMRRLSAGSGGEAAPAGAVIAAIVATIDDKREAVKNGTIGKLHNHTGGAVGAAWVNAVSDAIGGQYGASDKLLNVDDAWLKANDLPVAIVCDDNGLSAMATLLAPAKPNGKAVRGWTVAPVNDDDDDDTSDT